MRSSSCPARPRSTTGSRPVAGARAARPSGARLIDALPAGRRPSCFGLAAAAAWGAATSVAGWRAGARRCSASSSSRSSSGWLIASASRSCAARPCRRDRPAAVRRGRRPRRDRDHRAVPRPGGRPDGHRRADHRRAGGGHPGRGRDPPRGLPPPLVLAGIGLAIVAVVLVSRVADEAAGAGPARGAHRGRRDRLFGIVISPDQRGHVFSSLTVIRSSRRCS